MRLAIIPARGGSKRIPRKNIINFAGRPLIAWSIIKALESEIFDRVIVSTDDQEIAEISKSFGADVPFMRPDELSDDFSGVLDVINHALQWHRSNEFDVDYACCIFPSAPFINTEDLRAGFEKLTSSRDQIVMSVCEYSSPIQRAFSLDESHTISPIWPKKIKERTQDLSPKYYDAGQFYWGEEDFLLNRCKALISDQSIGIILPESRVQDIDNINDLFLAEAKFINLERQKVIPKLTVGTANFSQNYGLINKKDMPQTNDIKGIFEYIDSIGITKIDTAIGYHGAQKILGKFGVDHFDVMTKLPSIPPDCSNIESWVNKQVESSLSELCLEKIEGIYFHDPFQLRNLKVRTKALNALQSLKTDGLIEKIGVSIYSPSILNELTQEIELDIVQAPMNLIDRRIFNSGWMDKLKKLNIDLVARSVFLQGLLLMEPEERPSYFLSWRETLEAYDKWIEKESISRIEACIQFILSFQDLDRIIFGFDNERQIREIAQLIAPSTLTFPEDIVSDDEGLVDPSKWKI